MKYPLIYGGIAGVVIIAIMATVLTLGQGSDYATSMITGYLVMLVVLSLIFIGTKRYRDIEQGGVISFGKAFGVGIGIAIVAAIAYALAWEVFLAMTGYVFIDDYSAAQIAAIEAQQLDAQAAASKIAEVESARTLYGQPMFRLAISFIEIFPVGLLVTLVSAFFLRHPKGRPDEAGA